MTFSQRTGIKLFFFSMSFVLMVAFQNCARPPVNSTGGDLTAGSGLPAPIDVPPGSTPNPGSIIPTPIGGSPAGNTNPGAGTVGGRGDYVGTGGGGGNGDSYGGGTPEILFRCFTSTFEMAGLGTVTAVLSVESWIEIETVERQYQLVTSLLRVQTSSTGTNNGGSNLSPVTWQAATFSQEVSSEVTVSARSETGSVQLLINLGAADALNRYISKYSDSTLGLANYPVVCQPERAFSEQSL